MNKSDVPLRKETIYCIVSHALIVIAAGHGFVVVGVFDLLAPFQLLTETGYLTFENLFES